MTDQNEYTKQFASFCHMTRSYEPNVDETIRLFLRLSERLALSSGAEESTHHHHIRNVSEYWWSRLEYEWSQILARINAGEQLPEWTSIAEMHREKAALQRRLAPVRCFDDVWRECVNEPDLACKLAIVSERLSTEPLSPHQAEFIFTRNISSNPFLDQYERYISEGGVNDLDIELNPDIDLLFGRVQVGGHSFVFCPSSAGEYIVIASDIVNATGGCIHELSDVGLGGACNRCTGIWASCAGHWFLASPTLDGLATKLIQILDLPDNFRRLVATGRISVHNRLAEERHTKGLTLF